MREILFRGKWLNNDAWVSGNLFVSDTDGRTYILAGSRTVTIECEIDPSTVGQYTGLKDKNGKRIFENGYMIIDKQTYKVLFDNGEYILKNIFNCDIIQLKNNSNIGVFVDEI